MRVLLTTLQYLGHVVPAMVFKHALEQRGHFVHWEICAVEPITGPLEKHLRQYEKESPNQYRQLSKVLAGGGFDCLISDPPIMAAWDLYRDIGMPWAIFGNLPIYYSDERVPLYLQCSIPEFEPRVRGTNIRFIGPMVPNQIIPKGKEPWWVHQNSKIVHVTEGTVAKNGLVQRVLNIPGPRNWSVVPEYFDYCHWMPEIDCFVTNAGFSGVSQALFHGVPMVLAGITEDKKEVSERVEQMGCGINLRTDVPTMKMLKNAIETCLTSEKMKQKCKEVAAKCKFFRAEQGVDALEELVFSRFARRA